MGKISVAIATFNEEANIADCLRSVKSFADEIVVVDGASQDQTRQIAQGLGARVIKTKNRPMFHINKNRAVEACTGNWILVLDADERVSPELGQEIRRVAHRKREKGDPVGFWIKRKNFFLTGFLKKGGQYPDPVIRFFEKGKGKHPEVSVHEQIEVDGRLGWLKNDLVHLSSPTFTRYLTRENRYSSLEAQSMAERKLKINLFNSFQYLFLKPISTFFSLFVRHQGFRDGFPGFVFSLFSGLHYLLAYVKYWEMKRSGRVRDIKQDWL